mmetsp:Transcript_68125/g.210776  ORF Transcript_68125/g.210776 Transcript_68125/m.210776 type:complete len:201 (-) Transcript_68125:936-1538(-)
MVARLSAGREDEVVADLVTPAEAVVRVDACARPVEEHVPGNLGQRRLGLHVEAVLLLVEADLAHKVPQDAVVEGVVAIRAIDACLREVHVGAVVWEAAVLSLIGVPPRGHGRATDELEGVVLNSGVPVVAGDEDPVAVQPAEAAVLDDYPLRALHEEGADALQGPVPAGGHAVGMHVGVARRRKLEAVKGEVVHGLPPGA